MGKILTAVVVIGAGAGFFGWYDLFHLTVSLLLLGVGTLLLQWWKRQTQLAEEEDEVEEEEGVGRQVFVGTLKGVFSLLLLAGAFSIASRTPLYGWFYDRDCPAVLEEVRILEEGKAHARIVQVVEERLQRKISSACQEEITEKKVRALIAWAEQVGGEEGLSKLRQAQQEAEGIVDSDLVGTIAAKLEAARLLEEIRKGKFDFGAFDDKVVVKLPDSILFEVGKADLTDGARKTLKKLADILNQDKFKGKKVWIEGHTDLTGSKEANQKLSEDRAKSVARVMVEYGIGEEQLVIAGCGESRPITRDDTPAGRAQNRRVKVIIQQDRREKCADHS